MNHFRVLLSVVAVGALFGSGGILSAQDAAVSGAFEEPPVLNAAQILKPQFYEGPAHRVRDAVPTYAGANRYVIESDYGRFTADGNALLAERVREVYAIGQLREVSKGEEYTNAALRAATSPVKLAKHLAQDPVGTVSSVPKGLWKFVNRAGQGIKEVSQQRERGDHEDSAVQDMIGVSKAKRDLASRFNVNPYSSNEVLQEELNRVAWTSFAGGATVKVLTMGLTGGAAIAASSVSFADAANEAVREMSPIDLRLDNQKRLEAMGIKRDLIERFLAQQSYSPLLQTHLVHALETLKGVNGRDVFIREAVEGTEGEQDAVFFSRTARLIARLYQDNVPMDRIVAVDGLPVVIGKNGEAGIALEWDYASWTENTAQFADKLRAFAAQNKPNPNTRDLPPVIVALSGDASPRFQQEMESRGVILRTRLDTEVLR